MSKIYLAPNTYGDGKENIIDTSFITLFKPVYKGHPLRRWNEGKAYPILEIF